MIALLGADWGGLVELVVLWMLLGALSLVVPLGFVLALVCSRRLRGWGCDSCWLVGDCAVVV